MKATELIEVLQKMVAEHGDRDVYTWAPDECWIRLTEVEVFGEDDQPNRRDDHYKIGDFHV
ncbi:hypothetical protein ISP17_11225 [Dyella ginsengisoli]|uniref:Uncharacterized protein n=1 Tax=Dyella ginsengisoli TaxID=363848 RepID=A0ABW8JXM5_9GAMM